MSAEAPLLLHSLWGYSGDLQGAMAQARRHGFDGLEANLLHPALSDHAPQVLADAGMPLIVELVTGGDYVPALTVSAKQHLLELEQLLERAQALHPLRISVITGSDAWPLAQQQQFLQRAVALAVSGSVWSTTLSAPTKARATSRATCVSAGVLTRTG